MINILLLCFYCIVFIWLLIMTNNMVLIVVNMVIIWLMMANSNLVGGIPTPPKNMSSSDWIIIIIPTLGEKESCSKPPTRWGCFSGHWPWLMFSMML